MLVESLLALVALADPLLGRATVAEILEAAPEEAWVRPDPEDTLYLDLDAGRVVIAMVPELAPAHAAQIRTLQGQTPPPRGSSTGNSRHPPHRCPFGLLCISSPRWAPGLGVGGSRCAA